MARQTSAPIRSSAAEVLTYIASTGDPQDNIEMRYEDENIWLTQKMCIRDSLSSQAKWILMQSACSCLLLIAPIGPRSHASGTTRSLCLWPVARDLVMLAIRACLIPSATQSNEEVTRCLF